MSDRTVLVIHLPYVEKVARLAYYAFWAMGAMAALNFALAFTPFGRDETDSNTHRSGLALHTDYGTGCQYLRASGGSLTPRLNGEGEQMGCRSTEGQNP